MSETSPVSITLGGNATVLIQCGDVRVITDPWLSGRIGPWRRCRPPALDAAQMGLLDAILISHAHPDHLDTRSLSTLPRATPILTPGGHPWRRLAAIGLSSLHEMEEWDSWSARGVRVTAVPSVHTRWSLGYVVEMGGRRTYFAGDAGPRTPFEEIGKRCGPIDVALVPVGGSSLAIGPFQRHLTPAAAVRATAILRPRVVIPIHWGHVPCFLPALDRFRGTADQFVQAMRLRVPEIPVLCPAEGESAEIPSG
ncbi:MAG: MBL fold metallo-hydrolase [Armatimonadetes bacterium]|nr:MBL fold metallo-hydrolase [Armatimonadota bacterium]